MTDAREVMSWDDLGAGSRALAEAVHNDDWIPDLVLGISRGGLLVAGAIAYALGIKNTATISVEFYEKSRSTVASEYVWRRTDRWITFPWSALPSVGGLDELQQATARHRQNGTRDGMDRCEYRSVAVAAAHGTDHLARELAEGLESGYPTPEHDCLIRSQIRLTEISRTTPA